MTHIYIYCLQEMHHRTRDTQTESEGMEKYISGKWKWKKAGIAILISDKIDLKMKAITRDKEGHFTILNGTIQQEDITLVNIYAPNEGAHKYI